MRIARHLVVVALESCQWAIELPINILESLGCVQRGNPLGEGWVFLDRQERRLQMCDCLLGCCT